jgi:hypothetical protein
VLVRPIFELSEALVIGIAFLVGLTLFVILAVTVVVFKYRKSVLIRAASREFCFAMLSFDVVIALGAILYVISPSQGDEVCHARPWMLGVGLIGTLGCLLAKTGTLLLFLRLLHGNEGVHTAFFCSFALLCDVERIRKIFKSDKFSRDVLTNRDLLLWICGLLLVELVFLIGFSGAELTYSSLELGA